MNKAMILAAGFGTRLKPWTDSHPKALVPVGGIPMLKRVINKLISQGFDEIVINTHHFSDQVKNYLHNEKFDAVIKISDESDKILDTGGGVLKASEKFSPGGSILIHNVDILSDAPLNDILNMHEQSGRDVTLVTSRRVSSRKLIFDHRGNLKGWHNLKSGEYRPARFLPDPSYDESAFSGIYVVNENALKHLKKYSDEIDKKDFPVMDFFLANLNKIKIGEIKLQKLNLIDIGKPDTLRQADAMFNG